MLQKQTENDGYFKESEEMSVADKIQWKQNTMPKGDDAWGMGLMKNDEVEKARKFHKSFPQYQETPLVALNDLAKRLHVGGIYIKDESYRFGLNAFKVLGGSYAMARYIAQKLNRDIADLGYEQLTSDALRNELGEITFYTTTDGNHGRGVAWAANKLKQKSVVHMPKGSSQTRLQNILNENARADILDMNYDDAVRLTAKESAEDPGSIVVQDTAWEGYEEIPGWIMQGYGTMALEASEQLAKADVDRPTHVFVQAGVGSLAGAIQGYFANKYPDNCPITVVVEADAAACLYKSAVKNDGTAEFVGGDLDTIMAGLACGEPNTISFEVLRNWTSCFVSAPNWVAAKGMRTLGNPLGDDTKVISGESGAVPLGLLAAIMEREDLKALRNALKLDENSKVLLFSTEGDTDPEKYREIVWDGTYPSPEDTK